MAIFWHDLDGRLNRRHNLSTVHLPAPFSLCACFPIHAADQNFVLRRDAPPAGAPAAPRGRPWAAMPGRSRPAPALPSTAPPPSPAAPIKLPRRTWGGCGAQPCRGHGAAAAEPRQSRAGQRRRGRGERGPGAPGRVLEAAELPERLQTRRTLLARAGGE